MEAKEPLRLVSISVRGLRALRALEDVPFDDAMTVVCGRNGCGKSSLLESLEILLDERKAVAYDAFSSTGEIDVEGVFSDSDGQTITLRSKVARGQRPQRLLLTRVHRGFGSDPETLALPRLRALFESLGIAKPGGTAKAPWVEAAREWIGQRPEEEFEESWGSLTSEVASRLPLLTVFRTRHAEPAEAHVLQLVTREARRLLVDQYPQQVETLNQDLNRDILPALESIRQSIQKYSDLKPIITASFDFSEPDPVLRTT